VARVHKGVLICVLCNVTAVGGGKGAVGGEDVGFG